MNAEPRQVVVACSALRRAYRDFLRGQLGATWFVFLDGPPAVIRARMEARPGHFFKAEMLDGQLSALEAPEADENLVVADIRQTPGEIVEAVVRSLSYAFTASLSPQR